MQPGARALSVLDGWRGFQQFRPEGRGLRIVERAVAGRRLHNPVDGSICRKRQDGAPSASDPVQEHVPITMTTDTSNPMLP